MKIRHFIRFIALTAILLVLISVCTSFLTEPESFSYQMLRGFYEEPEGSLDVVCVGGSNIFTAWAAPLVWENYGVTSVSFAVPSMRLPTVEYMIREARKTQPDAVYLICINTAFTSLIAPKVADIHYVADSLPFSLNKLRMIDGLADLADLPLQDRLEFYFPLIRYHTRWEELSSEDFNRETNGMRSGSVHGGYLVKQNGAAYTIVAPNTTQEREPLDEDMQETLDSLLNYLVSEQVKAEFVLVPEIGISQSKLAMANTIADQAEARGYPTIDLSACQDEIHLDYTKDYYDVVHHNVHGACKTCAYLAEQMIKRWDLSDKRGDPQYAYWDETYEGYRDSIAAFALDVEYRMEKRDTLIPAPGLAQVEVDQAALTVSWNPVKCGGGVSLGMPFIVNMATTTGRTHGPALRLSTQTRSPIWNRTASLARPTHTRSSLSVKRTASSIGATII